MNIITKFIYFGFAVLALACFTLSPTARAVVPAPDGGYPGFNTAEGTSALQNLTTGVGNTVAGWHSLFANSAGNLNTAIGAGTLLSSTGDNNTAIGALALLNNTTGSRNVALGVGAGSAVTTANNVIAIGAPGANFPDESCYIGNIFAQIVNAGSGTAVVVDATGKLGTAISSRRFKRDIKPMDHASEAILALKPVTFHYKSDAKSTPCFGLIAEEVEKVDPDLVLRDKNGEILSVRYEHVNAMLLNEFLKEHRAFLKEQRKVEVQEKTIADLKSGMTALAATVKEQASQIQKVSAQLETSKPAPQTVLNNR